MKGKILTGILLSMILALALVSAAIDLSFNSDLSKAINTTELTITNNENSTYNFTISTPINITDAKGKVININVPITTIQIANGTSSKINLSYSSIPSGFAFGTFSTDIFVKAVGNDAINKTATLNFVNSFCDSGNVGTGLEIRSIKDKTLDNEDEWEWNLLNDIEITVKVKSTLDDDIDAVLEYGLYDTAENEFVDINEEEIDFSIDEEDTEEITIEFQVPEDLDFDKSSKTYRFYIKVYEEGEEENLCIDKENSDYYQVAEIKKESRDVVISKLEAPTSSLCGEAININAKVFNIGRKDEDKVKISLINRDLGVNLEKEIDNLDVGDSSNINFEFSIPKNATEKTYTLTLITYFDYDDETYDKSEQKQFTLKVEGNCKKETISNAAITVLEGQLDEVKAGEEVTIKATIRNTGDETTTYIMSLEGNEAFSTLQNINPSTLTLDAGQSKDALITLKLNNDASGEYTFNIKASFDTKEVSQPVSLSVTGKAAGITGSAIIESIKGNWFIWVIVLINIILIIAIIVVAVRISKA